MKPDHFFQYNFNKWFSFIRNSGSISIGISGSLCAGIISQFPETVELVMNGKSTMEKSLQFRIFNRTPDLVEFWRNRNLFTFKEDQEIWHSFDEAKEILTEMKLKDMIWNKLQDDEEYSAPRNKL